jgi:hypothetical protein
VRTLADVHGLDVAVSETAACQERCAFTLAVYVHLLPDDLPEPAVMAALAEAPEAVEQAVVEPTEAKEAR